MYALGAVCEGEEDSASRRDGFRHVLQACCCLAMEHDGYLVSSNLCCLNVAPGPGERRNCDGGGNEKSWVFR